MKKERITFGQCAADRCAKIFASWKFGLPSLLILNIWVLLNQQHIIRLDPDLAYANFFLSQLTYFVDLVLMMSAVRLAVSDREKLMTILGFEKKHTEDIHSLKQDISELKSAIALANSRLDTLLKGKRI